MAIVPAPLSPEESDQEPLAVIVLMPWWGRAVLLVLAGLLVGVFVIALYLYPYRPNGSALRDETHRQLGLPRCTFKFATGLPCPSCGMTTSFALLIRGDVGNSLRANAAGTVLGVFCLAFIPWAVASAFRGHLVYIRSVERALTRVVFVFLALMLVRWGIVLLVYYT